MDPATGAHFDSLGRTVLTLADNGQNGKYETRVELDIEGNQRAVIDAKDRIVMQYDYDLLGNQVRQVSMEAGTRWALNDVAGKPIYGWDSRGHRTYNTYDELQRPTGLYVSSGGNPEVLAEKTVYGETLPNPEQFNHRGCVYQVYDGAGVAINIEYDFKVNLLSGQRQLLQDYKNEVDWTQSPSLESKIFTSSTQFDALNRAVQIVAPHSDQGEARINVVQPIYNEANFLEQVDAWIGQSAEPQAMLNPSTANLHAVENINYDAKGQRTRIEYGNNVFTTYEYDPDTFRLMRLKTTRTNGGDLLQDLQYVYDPAGNITYIRDDAQQTVYFNNQVVEPHAAYRYDAIYRIEDATGREHIGQVSKPETSWNDEGRTGLGHPSDGQQMRGYKENYEYDEIGNILNLIHQANNGNWTRAYSYNEASLVESGKKNNRLSATSVGNTTGSYEHNEHGSMTSMPHLPAMEWDFEDQLHVTQRQVVNNGNTPERTYYVYDAAGERVRKVTERQNGTRKEERLYLGGFEIYRDYNGNGTVIELERETLHIMDDTQRIAMIETKTIDTNNDPSPMELIRYQFSNHLGSASLELDYDGKVISYEEYYPYGSTSYQAVDKSIKAAAKRYRYTGKERDEETGLYYHGVRYCASWLGRWTSADPAGMVDGTNLFRFARNNPVAFVDPNGKTSCDPKYATCIDEPIVNSLDPTDDKNYPEGSAPNMTTDTDELVRSVHEERKEETLNCTPAPKHGIQIVGSAYHEELGPVWMADFPYEEPEPPPPLTEKERKEREFKDYMWRSFNRGAGGGAPEGWKIPNVNEMGHMLGTEQVLDAWAAGGLMKTGGQLTLKAFQTVGKGTKLALRGPWRASGNTLELILNHRRQYSWRHLFWNPNKFRNVSQQYWRVSKGAQGKALHHWLFQHQTRQIPLGLRNAGFNLLEIPSSLNSWMGGRFAREVGFRIVVGSSLGSTGYGAFYTTERLLESEQPGR